MGSAEKYIFIVFGLTSIRKIPFHIEWQDLRMTNMYELHFILHSHFHSDLRKNLFSNLNNAFCRS